MEKPQKWVGSALWAWQKVGFYLIIQWDWHEHLQSRKVLLELLYLHVSDLHVKLIHFNLILYLNSFTVSASKIKIWCHWLGKFWWLVTWRDAMGSKILMVNLVFGFHIFYDLQYHLKWLLWYSTSNTLFFSRAECDWLHFIKISPDTGAISVMALLGCALIPAAATLCAHPGSQPFLNMACMTTGVAVKGKLIKP